MSIFNFLPGRSDSEKVKLLEKRVDDLESTLLEVTYNFKKLASLSLKLGEELENLVQHVRDREKPAAFSARPKNKPEDFYN